MTLKCFFSVSADISLWVVYHNVSVDDAPWHFVSVKISIERPNAIVAGTRTTRG